jgi:DNA topoisomerase-1
MDELCPVCGTPQVKVMKFKSKARVMCLSPDCPTKKGPEIVVGACPQCGGQLRVHYSQVGTRYIRCENYDTANHAVSYPLPQAGDIQPTDEVCEPCGAPKVIITTRRGPWKVCVDPDCPNKPKTNGASRYKARGAGKGGAKKGSTGTKKPKGS